MLYISITAYDEAPTVGLLLWRLRSVMQEFAREYEILVYNDGSTDATAETLASYAEVLPLTVLGGPRHLGYARALDELVRAVSKRTRYPRRDGLLTMQADFTDRPEDRMPAFQPANRVDAHDFHQAGANGERTVLHRVIRTFADAERHCHADRRDSVLRDDRHRQRNEREREPTCDGHDVTDCAARSARPDRYIASAWRHGRTRLGRGRNS